MAELDKGQALDWDDEAVVTDEHIEPLDPGTYVFEVKEVTRRNFNGSDKMSKCPIADITLELTAPKRKATVHYSLFLHSKFMGRITEFFVGLGVVPESTPEGQNFKMPWSKIPGMTGYCETKLREYNGDKYTDIKHILAPSKFPKTTATQALATDDYDYDYDDDLDIPF